MDFGALVRCPYFFEEFKKMFVALFRFIFFFMPVAFLNGISFILFDNVEILGIDFDLIKRKKKDKKKLEQKIIKNYLKECYKKDQN